MLEAWADVVYLFPLEGRFLGTVPNYTSVGRSDVGLAQLIGEANWERAASVQETTQPVVPTISLQSTAEYRVHNREVVIQMTVRILLPGPSLGSTVDVLGRCLVQSLSSL